MFTDKIFLSIGRLQLASHPVCNILGASLSSVDLCHGISRMTKNAIVMSRSVGQELISRDAHLCVPTIHIGSRPAEGNTVEGCISRKLRSGLDRFLNALDRQSTEVGRNKGLIIALETVR